MNYESMVADLSRWDGLFGGGVPSKDDIEAAMRGDVDAKTLLGMKSYTHTIDRQSVVVTASCINPPEEWSLDEFERAVASFVASVPTEKRSAARVVFRGGYEETCDIAVTYERPQTDEEWGLDIAHALMHVREREQRDWATFHRLKEKYGDAVNGQSAGAEK